MQIIIPDVLSGETLAEVRRLVLSADWVDGNVTSGAGAALAKRNRQLPETSEAARAAQAIILKALAGNALFLSAALPKTIFPPLFNAYGLGEAFGTHVDNAVRVHGPSGTRIRTDLSATLFLSDPESYDGGELSIESPAGGQRFKLPAGHMLLYPSTTLHQVTEVTRGERVACFFWLQSMVSSPVEREMLFNLDQSIQRLAVERGLDDPEVIRLTGVYHNLIRHWANV